MSAKTERVGIIKSGDPLAKHSLNQGHLGHIRAGEEKFFGTDKKAARARQKRELLEDQRLGMQLLDSRKRMQFRRALKHVFDDGNATPQEMDYIARHGQEVECYITKRGFPVAITIVDFNSRNK